MIFHKCNLLTTFSDDVIRYYDRIHDSNRFHTTSYNAYYEAVSVTRLVKAEIVSPYYGILINTGMGNLTMPLITASGRQMDSTRKVGTHKKLLLPL